MLFKHSEDNKNCPFLYWKCSKLCQFTGWHFFKPVQVLNFTYRRGAGGDEEMEYEGFTPSVNTRYRQILLPCLKLCLSTLVSLGTENENAANQVI